MDCLPTGYEFDFVDPLPPEKECAICRHAARNPVQLTSCGHRYCKNCLKTLVECSEPQCPQDRKPIPPEGEWFHDKACEREILSLSVKCKKNKKGCDWVGELSQYLESNHIDVCPCEEVTCEKCDRRMERRSFNTHMELECPCRIVKCEYCEKELDFWEKKGHQDECPHFPVKCPQKCGEVVPRMETEVHERDACMMTTVYCPYKEVGCSFHDKRSNLKTHIEASNENHLTKVSSKLVETTKQLKQRETETKSLKQKLMKQDSKVIAMQKEIASMKNRLSQLEDGTENELPELYDQLEELRQETDATKTRVKELEVVEKKVAHLLNWKTAAQHLMRKQDEQIMALGSSIEKREEETCSLKKRVDQLESRDEKTVSFVTEDFKKTIGRLYFKLKATLEKELLNQATSQVNTTNQFSMRRNREIKEKNRFAPKRSYRAYDPLSDDADDDDDDDDIAVVQKRMSRNLHAAKKLRRDDTIDDDHY